mgnify:CR=1 FL=1
MEYTIEGKLYKSPEPTTFALQVKFHGAPQANVWRETMFVKYKDDPFIFHLEKIQRLMESVPMWGGNLIHYYTINVKNVGYRFPAENRDYDWITGLIHLSKIT